MSNIYFNMSLEERELVKDARQLRKEQKKLKRQRGCERWRESNIVKTLGLPEQWRMDCAKEPNLRKHDGKPFIIGNGTIMKK